MVYNGDIMETTSGARSKVNSHANLTNNPNNVTKSQVGLGNVQNYAMAEVTDIGTTTNVANKYMNPLRTRTLANNLILAKIAIPKLSFETNAYVRGGRGISVGSYSENNGLESVLIRDYSLARSDVGVALGTRASSLNDNLGVLGGTASNATNRWSVPGVLTVSGIKNFEMPHPHPDKKIRIVYAIQRLKVRRLEIHYIATR
ncbi:hypothetical protein ACFSKI_21390 [Pseudogracilibacillus auburnensis]|uniref:Uncharacterized protein n=1 Tax=Pseudogracilibacillus auburnensis TaxID=1494959 RepID=A0A2V3VIK7_9BACI|nr:hypothetical protein [Pseudogracilibacillus auburnensis]PXW81633.1 hypothetical protein DFR56_1206 [Pseudogracilibacillus auburnensis]